MHAEGIGIALEVSTVQSAGALGPGGHSLMKKARPYLFILPIMLFAVGFIYYPFIKTVLYSFSTVNAKGVITGYAGLENFKYLFSRRDFKIALENTLKITAINVPATVALTMGLALLANKKRRLSPVYETLFTLPMAIAMSAAAMIFKVLLNPTVGYLNYALGIDLGWYQSREHALYGILMLTVWMGIGFDFLLFLSAFRAVPDQLIEAGIIDGAGPVSRFVKIQLPLISPTILFVALTNMVLAMMVSGPVIILTQGGPARSTTTLIFMMFNSGYGSANYSLSACVSLVAFVLTFSFTLLAFYVEKRKVHYQ
jgi:sn-glycerol 3-phosphate transport system permease protein